MISIYSGAEITTIYRQNQAKFCIDWDFHGKKIKKGEKHKICLLENMIEKITDETIGKDKINKLKQKILLGIREKC